MQRIKKTLSLDDETMKKVKKAMKKHQVNSFSNMVEIIIKAYTI